jgi:aldose 1-epimerase
VTVGTETVDSAVLRAPGHTVLQVDDRGIPTGAERVEGTEYDFDRPRRIGTTKLDNSFTDLERGDDGLARVELLHPDGEPAISLWLDASYPYLTLFTGDTQPSVDRRSLAVEPSTCPPNAFRSGESIVVLEPGESTRSVWGIEP